MQTTNCLPLMEKVQQWINLTSMITSNHPLIATEPTIFSPEATQFVSDLIKTFKPQLTALLDERRKKQDIIDQRCKEGQVPLEFIKEELYLKPGEDINWKGPSLHPKLTTRHVEITGPASEARMVYNSFHCGADVYMSDFEDSLSPTAENIIKGQINLYHAVRKTLTKDNQSFLDTATTLVVRSRGLHLKEYCFMYENEASPASLIDFGYFFFNNAAELLKQGSGPFFYLPKLQHWEEAAWWAAVFSFSERYLGLKHGSIRATVLIETLPAMFEMDAIIYALKDYCAGLNCGRWDYIFSYMKTLNQSKKYQLPDRKQVTMSVQFMKHYSLKLIETCHRRGIHAMGGMSATVPYKITEGKHSDYYKEKNNDIIQKIIADKQQEATNGHDGAWSAHPDLVPIIKETFEKKLNGKANQIEFMPNTTNISDMLDMSDADKQLASCTEEGLKTNINVGLQYVIAWLNGVGAVGISYQPEGQHDPNPRLMEDLATAEISRTQIQQWWMNNQDIVMNNGEKKPIRDIFYALFEHEKQRIKNNTQIVKYDTTPAIETLKNNLKQCSNDDYQTIEKTIKQKQDHTKKQFEIGCKLFEKICTSDTLECLFFPDIATPHLFDFT